MAERSVAQFFFEVGYGSCFAEAYIRNGSTVPWPMSEAEVERAWEGAGEAHDDPEEFDRYLALATRPATSPITGEARETAYEAAKPFMGVALDYDDLRGLVGCVLAALPLASREGWQEEVGEADWREACDYLDHYAEYIRSVHSSELERHPYLPALQRVAGSMRAALSRTGEVSLDR